MLYLSGPKYGRLAEIPLPVRFVLLGLRFDSGLGYRDFVAYVDLNPHLLQKLGVARAPSYSMLQKALTRIDT